MTTLQMQHTSPVGSLAAEDPMEVTSEMDRDFEAGEDIDIDLDINGENQRDEEDEYMLEDKNALTQQENTEVQDIRSSHDDDMADDGYVEGLIAERYSVHDEDLEDAEYVEPGVNEDTIVQAEIEGPFESYSELFDNEEQNEAGEPKVQAYQEQGIDTSQQLDDTPYHQEGMSNDHSEATTGTFHDERKGFLNNSRHVSPPAVTLDALHQDNDNGTNKPPDSLAIGDDDSSTTTHEIPYTTHQEILDKNEDLNFIQAEQPANLEHDELASAKALRSEQEMKAPSSSFEPGSQGMEDSVTLDENDLKESYCIHPVTVIYQDNEISLFPPIGHEEDRSSTYFLQDEQLANESISKLLGACRTVLGESISTQEELIIELEELGLQLGEFAPESSTTILKDLVDVYVHLQHYDGHDDPPALYIQLTTKPRFSHRLEFLMTAIAEGKGLSQIRSSNDNEDYPKLGSEPTSSSRVANPINASLVQDSGATEDLPDETSEGIRVEESLQSTATILTSPSEDSHNAVRSLEVKPNRSMNGRVIDQRRTRSDTIVNDNLAIEAGGDNDSSTQADGPAASIGNEAGRWQESKPERNDEEIFAHGDIIDYEGEEEQARVTSSGSSTLQGDHLDSATDGPLATSDKGLPSEEVPAHIGLGAGVLTRQLTDDPAGDKANLSNGDSQNASQVLENDAASADYFEEQYENTSDSHYEEANDQENNDEEVKDGEFRNEEYEGEDEDEDVDEGGDEDEGDEDGEILEVLGNGGRPQSADAFRVLDANDFEDAASAPQKDKADLVQADVWHDQEYGVTVSDGVLKSKSSNKERAEWAYRHELSQDDHDTSGIPQSDHQIILDHIQESIEIGHATNTSAESNGSQLPSNTDLKAETWAKSSDQVQDDDDEITYEDDENKGATRDDPVNTDHNATSSPNSLKRARGFQDLDEASEAEIQDAKRFRSG